jgi:hypothetical protein
MASLNDDDHAALTVAPPLAAAIASLMRPPLTLSEVSLVDGDHNQPTRSA